MLTEEEKEYQNRLERNKRILRNLGYDEDLEISISTFNREVSNRNLSSGVTICRNPKITNINNIFSICDEKGGKFKTLITLGEKASKEEKIFDSEGKALNYLLFKLKLHHKSEEEKNHKNSQMNYRF